MSNTEWIQKAGFISISIIYTYIYTHRYITMKKRHEFEEKREVWK